MASRRLPLTFESLAVGIQTLLGRINLIPNADLPMISEANLVRIRVEGPAFLTEMNQASTALRNQVAATADFYKADAVGDLLVSVFVQNINFAIRLWDNRAPGATQMVPADRVYYKLDANSEKVPEMRSDGDSEKWMNNMITGEADRIAAGGTPLPFPLIANIQTAYTDWKAKRQQQSILKDMAQNEGLDLTNTYPATRALLVDIYDEIGFYYRKLADPARRQKEREFGVPYTNDPGEVYEEDVTVPVDGFVVVEGVDLEDTNQVTLTILQGDTVKFCRNNAACVEGTSLTPDAPVQIAAGDILGQGDNLALTSGGTVVTVVRVKVVG